MASQPLTPAALRALMHDHPDVVQITSAPAFGQENEDDMMKGAATLIQVETVKITKVIN